MRPLPSWSGTSVMNMNSIPPLQTSIAEPIIMGTKYQHKDEAFCSMLQHNVNGLGVGEGSSHLNLEGIPHFHGNTKYIMDITERSRVEKVSLVVTEKNVPHSDGKPNIKSNGSQCYMRKVGTCFVIVKNDPGEILPTGKRQSLPGEVESDEFEHSSFAAGLQNMKLTNKFWNFSHQFQNLEKTEKFMKYARHCILQMRKFIKKLEMAIAAEEKYLEMLHVGLENKEIVESDDSFSNHSNHPNVLVDFQPTKQLTPPKLGKVYAELQSHSKVWSEILQQWQDSGLEMSTTAVGCLVQFQKKIESCQNQVISLTNDLISIRLQSLASCAVSTSTAHKEDYNWPVELGSGALKRFCKLIETYNNILRKKNVHKPQVFGLGSQATSTSTRFLLPDNVCRNAYVSKLPSEFTAARIVAELSEPGKDGLGALTMHILAMIYQSTEFLNRQRQDPFIEKRIDWGKLDDVEFDEDDVIQQIMGYDVPHISDTELSSTELSGTKDFMYAQGSFIVAFMNCLAANTSLMRHKMRGKSPRSGTSSQYLTDEAVSALSSDEEVSSVASSSFLSHMSGNGSAITRRRKTVLWRDSWDQEAVKSLSKAYMAALVTEGPSSVLQTQLSQLVCTDPLDACYFGLKPRVGGDVRHLLLDAFINNMIALELLPRDILCSAQCSTQAFVIDRALIHWDSKLCEALALSAKDKCGAMPVKGSHPLTKTALTYVQAIHALMAIMKKYHDREDVARKALSRLETTLDAFYRWCHEKINHYLTAWSLRPLLQICLGDLSQLTAIGLSCLPLVEKCHNYVESRRTENPATLYHATKYLNNVDNIITNMQSLSGDCMRSYSSKCSHLAKLSICETFPSHKLWRQKNLTDHSSASSYMENSVRAVLEPVCTAVRVLNPRCQLTAVPPAVTALLDVTVRHIVDNKIRFSLQGALQLQRDFEFVTEYASSRDAGLCVEVTRSLLHLSSVKRAMRAVKILQRTDLPNDAATSKGGMRRRTSRVSAFNVADDPDGHQQQPEESTLLEKQLLALRVLGGSKGPKKWFRLPCSDDAME